MSAGKTGVIVALRAAVTAPWSRNPRLGIGLIVTSSVISIVVAFLGPSAVTLRLGPRSGLLPPWYLPSGWVSVPEWVAVPALWAGLFMGAAGLYACWGAINAGWRTNNRRLFALGSLLSVVTSLVPPMTSADVLMYAAYGRLQVLGLNPYQITPAQVFRSEFDPLLVWTERPWQDTPSVYGPLASASQWLAAWLGGGNMHDTVFWFQVFAVVPFLIIGAVVVKLAHDDRKVQTRAVLFTVLNPLMIWAVLSGAHNEALTLVFAVGALWFIRRQPFVAGLGIGLAGTIKVSLVFYGIAMAWGYRRDPRKLIQLLLGAAIPLFIGYGVLVPGALLAAGRNSGYISFGSWAPWLQWPLGWLIGDGPARQVVAVVGWILMVKIAWMLSRVLPWRAVPGLVAGVDPRLDPLTITARTAATLTAAWLVSSPYTLSWYDLITWAPLGLLAASRLDLLLIWRGVWLSAAYVTGRAIEFGPAMRSTADFIRDVLCSGAQVLVLVAIVTWWWRAGREMPAWLRWPTPRPVPDRQPLDSR